MSREHCTINPTILTRPVMAQHRQTVNIYVRTQDHPVLQQCLNDPTMKVYAFCAAANQGIQDVCFPYQSELKVNGGEVKANLRGLKNKPGSTRPVDLTPHLRLRPSTYNNNVEFTYALTSKVDASVGFLPRFGRSLAPGHAANLVQQKFYFGVYVCKVTPIEGLVEQIQKSKRIAKASVIQERMYPNLHFRTDFALADRIQSRRRPAIPTSWPPLRTSL